MKEKMKKIGKNQRIAILQTISIALIVTIVIGLFNLSSLKIVNAQSGICQADFQSVAIPLTELGNNEYIRMDGQHTGFTGGLYPNGSNQRPAAHEAAGLAQAALIQPLNTSGAVDRNNGKIVFVSIGMSNTNYEFQTFIENAASDPQINPELSFVNGALPGQTSDRWVDPSAPPWQALADTLTLYHFSPQQVQVVWIKETQTQGGDFPDKAQALQADLQAIVHNLHSAYPNVRIVYFSSRIYSYTYFQGLSPEPNAFETGFAVKWLIEQQIDGDPNLNFDASKGVVNAPYLTWGPYLWANGQIPRSDGLVWLPEDLTNDCTHPAASGRSKVANMLMEFLKNDTTSKSWFLKSTPEDGKIYLPIISTATATVHPSTPSRSPSPTPEKMMVSATMTPILLAPVEKPESGVSLWVLLWDWIRRLFTRK